MGSWSSCPKQKGTKISVLYLPQEWVMDQGLLPNEWDFFIHWRTTFIFFFSIVQCFFYYYFTFSPDKESLSFTTLGTSYFLTSAAFMAYIYCLRPYNQVARLGTRQIGQMCLGQESGMSWFYWQLRSDRKSECQNGIEAWNHVLVSCSLACPFKKQPIEHSYLCDQILF